MGRKFENERILALIMMVIILVLLFGCDVSGVNENYFENNNETVCSNNENNNNKIINSPTDDDINLNDSDTRIPINQDIYDLLLTEVNDKETYIETYRQYWNSVIIPSYGLMDKDVIELKRHGNMTAEEFIEREREIWNNNCNQEAYGELVKQANMLTILGFITDKTIISAILVDMDNDNIPELVTARLNIEQNENYTDNIYLIMEVYTVKKGNLTLLGNHKSEKLFSYCSTSYNVATKSKKNSCELVISSINNAQSLYQEELLLFQITDNELIQITKIHTYSGESFCEYIVNDIKTGIQFTANSSGTAETEWNFSGQNFINGLWIEIDINEDDTLELIDSLKHSVNYNSNNFLQIEIVKTDITSEFYLGQPFIGEVHINNKFVSPELGD